MRPLKRGMLNSPDLTRCLAILSTWLCAWGLPLTHGRTVSGSVANKPQPHAVSWGPPRPPLTPLTLTPCSYNPSQVSWRSLL